MSAEAASFREQGHGCSDEEGSCDSQGANENMPERRTVSMASFVLPVTYIGGLLAMSFTFGVAWAGTTKDISVLQTGQKELYGVVTELTRAVTRLVTIEEQKQRQKGE